MHALNVFDLRSTDWLTATKESLLLKGKGAAFCKLCATPLRAHRTDLLKHRGTMGHQKLEKSLTRDSQGRKQPTIVKVIGKSCRFFLFMSFL